MDKNTGKLAKDLMQSDVFSLSPTMLVTDMDMTLLEKGINGAPVVQEGKLLGVVSRVDISREMANDTIKAEENENFFWGINKPLLDTMIGAAKFTKPVVEHLQELCVQDIMTTRVISVEPDAPVSKVASLMWEKDIHRVLVVKDDAMVGIIESLDLVKLLAE